MKRIQSNLLFTFGPSFSFLLLSCFYHCTFWTSSGACTIWKLLINKEKQQQGFSSSRKKIKSVVSEVKFDSNAISRQERKTLDLSFLVQSSGFFHGPCWFEALLHTFDVIVTACSIPETVRQIYSEENLW